jgi:hypothetical protein
VNRKRLVGAAAIVVTVASCGDTPTSPSTQSPPLGVGNFILAILGDSSLCQDIKVPQAGTFVTVQLRAVHDGNVWIGRAASAEDGDFEIRLARTNESVSARSGPIGARDVAVAGSLSGVATDSYKYVPTWVPSGTSAVFGQPTTISGIVRHPFFRFGDGLNLAALTFTRAGVSSTCPAGAVGWTLNGPT